MDESRFKPVNKEVSSSLRRKLSKFSDDDIVVTAIASFIPRKNHRLLVEAARLLPEQYKIFLAGPIVESGPLTNRASSIFDDLVRTVAKHNLEKRVQLTNGFIENIEEYYQMSDLFAFPSLSEGLGTPVLESIACGIPVVANRIEGVTDVWIKDGVNGYLSALTPSGFAEKIILASSLSLDKRKLGSENMLKVAGTESIDRAYAALINKCLS